MNKLDTDLLKYLADKMQEEIEVIKENLAMGRAEDHSDYRYACGIVRGLTIAQNIIIETNERMKHE